jgi:hypothetical protein
MNLNLEVVAPSSAEVQGTIAALKVIAFAERLNERQRNLLRLWHRRRLRIVRRSAEDGLEETLARELVMARKARRDDTQAAAFVVCV